MTTFDTTVADGGATVIRPSGRLDMISAPALKAVVSEAVSRGNIPVVVDLASVEFMDSSGLGAMISGLRSTRQAGSDLRIAGVTAQVLAILELTNIDRILHPFDNVAEALGGG